MKMRVLVDTYLSDDDEISQNCSLTPSLSTGKCANHTCYQVGVLSTLHECTVLQTFIYTFMTQ